MLKLSSDFKLECPFFDSVSTCLMVFFRCYATTYVYKNRVEPGYKGHPIEFLVYYFRPFRTIWDHLRPLKTKLNLLGPFYNYLEIFGPFLPFGTNLDDLEPIWQFWTMSDFCFFCNYKKKVFWFISDFLEI